MDFDVQKSASLAELLQNPRSQQQIITQTVDSWNKGKRARRDKEQTAWLKCWKMFTQYLNKDLFKQQPWRSKLPISWSYTAVNKVVNRWMQLLFPDKEDFFKIKQTVAGDPLEELNAHLMDNWMRYRLEQMQFMQVFRRGITEAAIIGQTCFKVVWKETSNSVPKIDPFSGSMTEEPNVIYSGPCIEHVLMDDFVVYPAVSNLGQSMMVQRIYKTLYDVQNNPRYTNTEKLVADGSAKWQDPMVLDTQRAKINMALGVTFDRTDKPVDSIIELFEAWGDFNIDGKMYRNCVATVANGTTLIRFQPNPLPSGRKPFVFFVLNEIPGQMYGYGVLEPAIGIHSMATTIQNMMLDELKLKIHPQMKYEPDGVFDPASFFHVPGGKHPVGSIENLVPILEGNNLALGFDTMNWLKAEFEEVTGVTKYSKGAESVSKNRTAREAVLLAQSEDDDVMQTTVHISDRALKPLLENLYEMVSQLDNIQEIASYSKLDPQMAMTLGLPLGERDFKITGVQTAVLQAKQLDRIENWVRLIAETPGAPFYQWDEIGEEYAKALNLETPERFMMPEQVRQMIKQVQLFNVMGPMMQQQTETQAVHNDHTHKMAQVQAQHHQAMNQPKGGSKK